MERVENFKYLGILFNGYKNQQIDSREKIKNGNTSYFMLQKKF